MSTIRQVWLNMNTGEFSQSWKKNDYPEDGIIMRTIKEELPDATAKGWKLLEYHCINDDNFELYSAMQIFTASKLKAI